MYVPFLNSMLNRGCMVQILYCHGRKEVYTLDASAWFANQESYAVHEHQSFPFVPVIFLMHGRRQSVALVHSSFSLSFSNFPPILVMLHYCKMARGQIFTQLGWGCPVHVSCNNSIQQHKPQSAAAPLYPRCHHILNPLAPHPPYQDFFPQYPLTSPRPPMSSNAPAHLQSALQPLFVTQEQILVGQATYHDGQQQEIVAVCGRFLQCKFLLLSKLWWHIVVEIEESCDDEAWDSRHSNEPAINITHLSHYLGDRKTVVNKHIYGPLTFRCKGCNGCCQGQVTNVSWSKDIVSCWNSLTGILGGENFRTESTFLC